MTDHTRHTYSEYSGEYFKRLYMALSFALDAHFGQIYKGYNNNEDTPYIMHPIRVASMVPPGHCVIVAILHDCLEDAGILPEWLTDVERNALLLLTRNKSSVTYLDYIKEIACAVGKSAEIARTVKLADLNDNIAQGPPPSLLTRYQVAKNILENAEKHLSPLPDYGDNIPWEEFKNLIEIGMFIDYDGHGIWSTETQCDDSGKIIKPSLIKQGFQIRPEWATHVCWFNR
jgi:hypothetical protein